MSDPQYIYLFPVVQKTPTNFSIKEFTYEINIPNQLIQDSTPIDQSIIIIPKPVITTSSGWWQKGKIRDSKQ